MIICKNVFGHVERRLIDALVSRLNQTIWNLIKRGIRRPKELMNDRRQWHCMIHVADPA